jgi:hypothetical protein
MTFKKTIIALFCIVYSCTDIHAGLALRTMRSLTRANATNFAMASRMAPQRFFSSKTNSLIPFASKTLLTQDHNGQKKAALTRFLPNQQNRSQNLVRNDFTIPLIIGGVIAAGALLYCVLCPESDMAVIKNANEALAKARDRASTIGGAHNNDKKLVVEQLTENELLHLSSYMQLEAWHSNDYIPHFNSSIKSLEDHRNELIKRVEQYAQDPEKQNTRKEMQQVIDAINSTNEILYNRRHLLSFHAPYFNLRRVQLIATRRYNSVLAKGYYDPNDSRVMIHELYRNCQFPILSCIDQLELDINATYNALQTYNSYPCIKASVLHINTTLDMVKKGILASADYAQAMRDKRAWETEQQRLAIERARVEAERDKANALHRQADAEHRQARELAEQNRLERERRNNPQPPAVQVNVNVNPPRR